MKGNAHKNIAVEADEKVAFHLGAPELPWGPQGLGSLKFPCWGPLGSPSPAWTRKRGFD